MSWDELPRVDYRRAKKGGKPSTHVASDVLLPIVRIGLGRAHSLNHFFLIKETHWRGYTVQLKTCFAYLTMYAVGPGAGGFTFGPLTAVFQINFYCLSRHCLPALAGFGVDTRSGYDSPS
jgi:hypothetical protein